MIANPVKRRNACERRRHRKTGVSGSHGLPRRYAGRPPSDRVALEIDTCREVGAELKRLGGALLLICLIGGVSVRSALAADLRSQRTVAGVRATITEYTNAVVDGNGKLACALLTKKAKAHMVKGDISTTCPKLIRLTAVLIQAHPKEAAGLRAYALKVRITLTGDIASVPTYSGNATTKLIYTHRLWYVN